MQPEALWDIRGIRVMRQLESYDLFFMETPLLLDDHSPIRVAAGELQNSRFEFLDLMDRGKVDVAQPDVGRVGGLTEARRVCDLAADRGRLIVPHCWKTGIGIAATAHLSASAEALSVYRVSSGGVIGGSAAAGVGGG